MAEFFHSGNVVFCVLFFMIVEGCVLWAARRWTQLALLDLAAALGAGAALMLALRSALRSEPWTLTALWLVVALAAHLLDLSRRIIFYRTSNTRVNL